MAEFTCENMVNRPGHRLPRVMPMPLSLTEIDQLGVLVARTAASIAPRVRVLGGIGEQVGEHLRQPQRIGLELHAGGQTRR